VIGVRRSAFERFSVAAWFETGRSRPFATERREKRDVQRDPREAMNSAGT